MAGSNPDDLIGPLLATFAAEAAEHLQAMNRHLLSLERGDSDPLRDAELFRAAHSMKGAARAVNLAEVEGLAHALEDIFAGLKDGPGRPGQSELDTAYRTLDTIATLVAAATAGVQADPPSGWSPGADQPAVDAAGRWEASPPRPAGETVRVATAKLDALMAEVGELLVTKIGVEQRLADIRALDVQLADWESAWSGPRRRGLQPRPGNGGAMVVEDSRARLADARTSVGELRRGLEADIRRMAQVTADLQDDVRRARMLPAAGAFEVFPRMVRDLAQASGKEVTFRVEGGDTEVDRSVLEHIKDPLTHLLRNCVDHGIESPQTRAGAGIDPPGVRAAAVQGGLLGARAAQDVSDRDAIPLIFRSGLSTSPRVTDLSGRGVGLDVVRDAVERLHGSIDVHSTTGRGTTFVLSLPLSVSSIHCLLLEAGGQTFALPATFVQRVVRVAADTIERAERREVVRVGDRPVALARLADVLGIETTADAVDPRSIRPATLLSAQGAQVALLVDRLTGTHELVVKSLPAPLVRVRHIAGAAVLGSGEVAMILNAADLVASVERGEPRSAGTLSLPDGGPATVLVAEDSITTRTLEKNLLEAAGYRVEVAADGQAAWRLLQSSDCDLVVADIEMPELDGFELTAKIRADPRC